MNYNSHKIYSEYMQMLDNLHLFLFEKGLIKDAHEISKLNIGWNLPEKWLEITTTNGQEFIVDASQFEKFVKNGFSFEKSKDLQPNNSFFKWYPEKFYPENLRSYLDISTSEATEIIVKALTNKWIIQGFEILSPDGSVIKSIMQGDTIPEYVEADVEHDGVYEHEEFLTHTLDTRIFYKSNKQ